MSIVSPVVTSPYPPIGGLDALGLEHCIYQRDDGIYADPTALGQTFLAAFEHLLRGNYYFSDLDYALVLKAIYDVGPPAAKSLLRFAREVKVFEPARRALYKPIKVVNGEVDYHFEPPAAGAGGAALTVDEFVAHLWQSGVRFGVDVAAVRAAIARGQSETVTVARRLPPEPGTDARIIEVSQQIHRSDAPLQLANGKLDLMAFQNRFPQIRAGARLLQKLDAVPGVAGFEVTGARLAPPVPADVELGKMLGEGTAIEVASDGQFLVARRTGYLDVDPASGKISIGDKIISRDGVSSRTTGNLKLTGDYEEFGEVQEQRVIEGEGITIHGDVYGHLISRGGDVVLNRNLVGGTAHNTEGLIRIVGIASNAVVQSRQGDIDIARADNCVISGKRIRIEHAVNCEIMGDEVRVDRAEGCAIAARRIIASKVTPRKNSDMLLYVLRPDSAEIDRVIAMITARVAEFSAIAARHAAELETMTAQPEVRRYVLLASKVRKKELVLTAEQLPQFQKMATSVGPALKAIAKVQLDVKAAETEREAGQALVEQLLEQRRNCNTAAQVEIGAVEGDTTVRTLVFNLNAGVPHDIAAKDIKARLRASEVKGELIFSGVEGCVAWSS